MTTLLETILSVIVLILLVLFICGLGYFIEWVAYCSETPEQKSAREDLESRFPQDPYPQFFED